MTKMFPSDKTTMSPCYEFILFDLVSLLLFISNRVVDFDVIDIIFYTNSFYRNIKI